MFPHIFTTFLLAIHSPLLYFYIPDIRVLDKSQITNNLMIDIQNVERAKSNLPLLTIDPTLTLSAKQRSCEINRSKQMDHANFYEIIYKNGYNKKASVGENLANNLNVIETIYGWLGSDTHRQIILDSEFTKIGIGNCGRYLVEHFGE